LLRLECAHTLGRGDAASEEICSVCTREKQCKYDEKHYANSRAVIEDCKGSERYVALSKKKKRKAREAQKYPLRGVAVSRRFARAKSRKR